MHCVILRQRVGQDLVLAVLVEREPIKLAPNSAQIPALLAMTKQNIYQMRQAAAPTASAAASAAAQSAPEVSNGSAAQAPAQQHRYTRWHGILEASLQSVHLP